MDRWDEVLIIRRDLLQVVKITTHRKGKKVSTHHHLSQAVWSGTKLPDYNGVKSA